MNPIIADDLVEIKESRYTLVVASAKRARQLLMGATPLVQGECTKPVTIALEELRTGKVKWVRTKEGIK